MGATLDERPQETHDGSPDGTAAAAVIDRIVHHATVLQTEGSSYRLKTAKARRKKS